MEWELSEAITYYRSQGAPGDQMALVMLLKEIQKQFGSIPVFAVAQIAQEYAVKESYLLAVIRRIPSLRLAGHHILQLCAGPNCGKSRKLAAEAERLCRQYPGAFELQYVSCMRLCGKGPNVKWDGKLYHKVTEDLLKQFVGEDYR